MIARATASEQGGSSTVTQTWVDSVQKFMPSDKQDWNKLGYQLQHDGQNVIYVDSRAIVGLAHGQCDDDFFQQGISETMNGKTRSSGENTLQKIHLPVFGYLSGKIAPRTEMDWRMNKKFVNDVWKNKLSLAEKILDGNTPKGPMTILLDEPEAGLSFPYQERLWKFLADSEHAQKFQIIIIATHSPFALRVKHAHIYEMEKGYLEQAKTAIQIAARCIAHNPVAEVSPLDIVAKEKKIKTGIKRKSKT